MRKLMTIFHVTIEAEIIIITLSTLETHSTEILLLATIAHNPSLIYSWMANVWIEFRTLATSEIINKSYQLEHYRILEDRKHHRIQFCSWFDNLRPTVRRQFYLVKYESQILWPFQRILRLHPGHPSANLDLE